MARVRYNIVVMTSSNHVRKSDFTFNRQPLRPGSVSEVFDEVVQSQFEHIGFGLRSFPRGTTKYPVRGFRFRGVGVDGTDVVMMFCPVTKACVVVKVVKP